MKRIVWLLLCALSLAAVPVAAQNDISRISIVADSDHAISSDDMARAVHHALQQAWPDLTIELTDNTRFQSNPGQSTLIVAIGDSLLPWLDEKKPDYAGAVAFYVGSAKFAAHQKNNSKLTALYRDQPLSRQINLARLLNPKLHRAAILRSETPLSQNRSELERKTGIVIAEAVVSRQSEWPKLLAQLMRDNDVLIGIDDSTLYNSETIRSILLTTYRHGKGVIGPNRAYVNAGSLASCYTSSEQYLQQLLKMVAVVVQEKKLPKPQYPKEFHVAINRQVATSLDIPVPDENTLSAWLRNQRGECGDGC